MERDNVQSQLRESNLLQQALRDKLENVQLDLASQGKLFLLYLLYSDIPYLMICSPGLFKHCSEALMSQCDDHVSNLVNYTSKFNNFMVSY